LGGRPCRQAHEIALDALLADYATTQSANLASVCSASYWGFVSWKICWTLRLKSGERTGGFVAGRQGGGSKGRE
jgi:hypothetical protein